jgi:hypothetical protein
MMRHLSEAIGMTEFMIEYFVKHSTKVLHQSVM